MFPIPYQEGTRRPAVVTYLNRTGRCSPVYPVRGPGSRSPFGTGW
jgi:hypothetical protein